MYPASTIASYFIKLSMDENKQLSPMKLQKLVYFAHGFYLALFDKPLISETVEAWKYGPVIPSLYHEYKYFGNQSIKDSQLFPLYELGVRRSIIDISEEVKEFLRFVWDTYKDYTAAQLSALTHLKDSPWETAIRYNLGVISPNLRIDDTIIKEYFKTKYHLSNGIQETP